MSHLFVVALILVLSWHYRGEGGVDLKGGKSSCFVPNLYEYVFQEDLSNLFVLATSAFSLNRPTPKMTLALSRGPAYNNLLLKPSCTSSTAGKAAHSFYLSAGELTLENVLGDGVLVWVLPALTSDVVDVEEGGVVTGVG